MNAPFAPALDVAVARSLDGFAALEPDWDALHDESGRTNPFLSYAWTRACFDEECGGAEPFILTLRRGGKLLGVAPLCIDRRFGFRILRFIAEDRSDYLGFLCDNGSQAIERQLMAELPKIGERWDLVVLRNLAQPFTAIAATGADRGLQYHRARWTTAAYCRWAGDWDSLLESGPEWLKQMRNRCRRFLKKGRTVRCFTGAEAAEWLGAVAQIEAKSWKGREGVARFQPGPGQEILRNAFLASSSQLELSLAFADNRAIAFQIDFLTPERLWMYQYSYDEAYATLRAGSVLQYMSIERAWQRGVREYDLMMGAESYKANRTTAVRAIDCVAGHPRTVRGYLAYWLLLAPRWKLRHVRLLKAAQAKWKRLRLKVSH